MREKVLELFKKSEKALSSIEVGNLLNLNEVNELTNLLEVLNELEEESIIYRTKKDKYILFEKSHLKVGIISITKKGYGFVSVKNESDDIYIEESNLNGALNKDLVAIEILKNTTRSNEGKVIKVLKKNTKLIIGEFMIKNNKPYFKPDDDKLNIEVIIDKEDLKNLVDGHKIQVSLEKELSKYKYIGKVNRIIGHKNDPGVDILSIVYNYDINDRFSEEVMNEVNNIPDKVSESEIIGRKDLRNETIFTIDGDDTKDIDDAISIEKNNDNYILGVHIADVSYYVRENTKLYEEAKDRGTSVYLVDRVIPMLPHKLSNGICSLNPNEDRLAITCMMTINKNGKVIDHEIFESVIKSKKQMTYKNVNKILNNEEVPEGYEEFVDKLKLMEELSNILRKEKLSRGFLEFDSSEAKILVDEKGFPYEIKKREVGKGENLIEDFMIVANETVATHVYYLQYPFVYRIHEVPDDEKIQNLLKQISLLGYTVKSNKHFENPLELKKIIDQLKDKNEFNVLSMLLLRCMKKAEYKMENVGHYGLGSKCYTHFTSPIRRFPDTTVHTLLRKYIFNKPSVNELNKLIDNSIITLPEICAHSSKKERDSIDCERDVENMKMAEYMENHIGKEYEGIIDSIMSFGMFIQLDNLIEGLVHVKDLKKDFFNYNEETNSLIGQRTHKIYKLGDRVKVKVISASKENSTIDFEIIEDKKGDENGNTK